MAMRDGTGHFMASAQAVSITQKASRPIKPDSSAMGMNSSGDISPRIGWNQRSSASNPVISQFSLSRTGW